MASFVYSFVVLVLGLVVGSFANVLIYRVPRRISILRPGSFCPECKAPLTANEKIPVLSFLTLGGKCAHCGKKISPRYPIIELANALGWLGVFAVEGFTFPAVVGCILFTGLLVAAATDLTEGVIPNKLCLGLGIFGLAASFYPFGLEPLDSLLGALVGGGLLLIFAVLGRLVFKREAMGGGDLKLLAASGAFLGWKLVLVAAFIAVGAGALYGAVYKIITRKETLPFGPFLAAGVMAAYLAGETILAWYLFL
ncbi:MAG: prepilin peptidase [bacterium]|nr:prepilin peptidase [bacterium]